MSAVTNTPKKYSAESNLGKLGSFLFKISGLFGLKFNVKSNVPNNKQVPINKTIRALLLSPIKKRLKDGKSQVHQENQEHNHHGGGDISLPPKRDSDEVNINAQSQN